MDQEKNEGLEAFFDLPPLERTTSRRKKPKPELWKILLAVLICLLMAIGSYFVGQVYGAELIPQDEVDLFPQEGEAVTDDQPKGPPILNLLMMGVDQRDPNESARADVIALVAMNLETKEINMINIPRDTRAAIAGTKQTRKINHAHALGGPQMMVETVENLLGVNVHYYVETNFEGFAQCIDLIGGVQIEVETRMYLPLEGIDLQPGFQTLDGHGALSYVRWRGDALADIGRISRQQKFLKVLMDRAMHITNLTKVPSLVTTMKENVQTDMSLTQMIALAKEFVQVKDIQLEAVTLPGVPDDVNYGASYWIMDSEKAEEIIQGIYRPVPEEEETPAS